MQRKYITEKMNHNSAEWNQWLYTFELDTEGWSKMLLIQMSEQMNQVHILDRKKLPKIWSEVALTMTESQ